MPAAEVVGEYVRVRQIEPELFKEETFRTIELSEEQGIKAVVGLLKDESKKGMVIQTYLFELEKGWDIEKATAWVDAHTKKDAEYFFMEG